MRPTFVIPLALIALSLTACDDEKPASGSDAVLEGRVFSVETGKPVGEAVVVAPGGEKGKTARDGTFEVKSRIDADKGSVEVAPKNGAPVEKPAPKNGGYVELYVKGYDAEKDLDPKNGGAVVAKNGASAKIEKGTLQTKDGSAPARAHVAIAAPNPQKSAELPSIPGNFDAKSGTKRGKVSTLSAVYVSAVDGDDKLELSKDKRGGVSLPVHARGSKPKAASVALFRYDEAQGLWVRDGSANQSVDADGNPVYSGDVSSLGWWAVGEFYDQLTCIRGCVRDADERPATSARVVVTGIDHVAELTTFAGDDGCFALDVRAGADVRVLAQLEAGLSSAELVSTSSDVRSADDDASACQDIGTLRIEEIERDDCPLGYRACGEACVDTRFDAAHCGACNEPCDATCLNGVCMSEMPATDAGMMSDPDAGTPTTRDDASVGPATRSLSVALTGSGSGVISSKPAGIDCPGACDASFADGTSVTLTAMPNDASISSFAGWSGDCASSKENTCVLDMRADRNVGASFQLMSRTLDVTLGSGNGTGSVIGQIDGGANVITCDGDINDCSESAPYGTSITLTALPGANSTFTWAGACAGTLTAACTVSLTEATSVSVTFSIIQYTLTMRVRDNGTEPQGDGTVASVPAGIDCKNDYLDEKVCTAVFDAGTSVQLTATPSGAPANNFIRWEGACASTTEAVCTITLTADTEVIAYFAGAIL